MNRLRTWLYFLLLLPTLWAAGAPTSASAQNGDVESVAAFFEPLSPYGDWMYTPEYGWVWAPWEQGPEWRPYTQGHWVWTDEYGWMWAAEEPWGWATYHYGRWTWMGGVWVWVPDVRWGPAWVAWRYTDTHVGWAPLPPGVAVGMYSGTVNVSVNVAWQYWVFVPGAYILMPNVYTYYVPSSQVQVYYYRAAPATRYTYYNGVVVCLGVHQRYVSTWVGGPVPITRVTYSRSPGPTVYGGGSVSVYRTPPPPGPAYRSAPPPPQRAVPTGMRTYVATPPPPSASRQPAGPAPSVNNAKGGSRGTYAPPPASSSRGGQGGQKGGSSYSPPAPSSGTRATPPSGASTPYLAPAPSSPRSTTSSGGTTPYQAPAPSSPRSTTSSGGNQMSHTPLTTSESLANPAPYRVPSTTQPRNTASQRTVEPRPVPSTVPTWEGSTSRSRTPATPPSPRSTPSSP